MQNQPRVSGFREAISPDGTDEHNYARSTLSSGYSGHPPSYQQWPEARHNSIPQDPASISPPTKSRALSEEIASPGLESVWADEGDKEVITQAASSTPPEAVVGVTKKPARICGLKRGVFWLLLIAVIVIVVALGAGLGAGLGTKNEHKSSATSNSSSPTTSGGAATASPTLTSDYYIGGALNPAYYSTTGAFNGSGLAIASQSFGSDAYGELVIYFQHESGTIRWQRLDDQGNWSGGTETEIVASDAKNSTPISAVAYVLNGVSTWHLFYVNTDNQLREKTNSNATNQWVGGPLNSENHTVFDDDQVGMQACWYGNDYGDSDYKHTALPSSSASSNASDGNTDVGMHMWYASDAQTFQQLGWRHGDTNWTFQQSWEGKNGHAGVGCYSWAKDTTTTYVMLVNQDNTAEIWWKDTGTNATSTPAHPINAWTNSSVAVNNVHPSSSLGYTNAFYAQLDSGWIHGYNVSWAAENTSFVDPAGFQVQGVKGIPGTKMSVTANPDQSGGDSLMVFCQVDGDDVTYFSRDLVGGPWTMKSLEIE